MINNRPIMIHNRPMVQRPQAVRQCSLIISRQANEQAEYVCAPSLSHILTMYTVRALNIPGTKSAHYCYNLRMRKHPPCRPRLLASYGSLQCRITPPPPPTSFMGAHAAGCKITAASPPRAVRFTCFCLLAPYGSLHCRHAHHPLLHSPALSPAGGRPGTIHCCETLKLQPPLTCF